MKSTDQRDIFRDSDAELARANRDAAETALRNPFETPDACRRRYEYHMAEVAKLEGHRYELS